MEEFSLAPLKKVFRFPFEGPDWQGQFLVGSALVLAGSFIPILPTLFVAGYALRVTRQVLAGQPLTLPHWDDWGALLRDGAGAFVIALVYLLPAMIVWFGGMALYFAAIFYLPFATNPGQSESEMFASFMMLTFGSMAVMFAAMALGTILGILGAFATPIATTHFAADGRLRAAFRVRQWWRVFCADRLGYVVAFVVVAGLIAVLYTASLVLYSTLILCALIPFLVAPAGFYLSLVGAALFGETYRHSATALDGGAVVEPSGDAP